MVFQSAGLIMDFNPPAPCGAGLVEFGPEIVNLLFQSTCPVRGRTGDDMGGGKGFNDFNPPAPCGAGPYIIPRRLVNTFCISIHLPRAGQDTSPISFFSSCMNFNPPAPCGAGPSHRIHPAPQSYFNPPAPCGAGPPVYVPVSSTCGISIHCPVRGRTRIKPEALPVPTISIHLPRAGQDGHPARAPARRLHFNPPAPCGAGQHKSTKTNTSIYAKQINRSICIRSCEAAIYAVSQKSVL